MNTKIADIKNDFSQWYQDVIYQAELVDQAPTRGCMVMRPYGYAIWELIQQELDRQIKATGTQNAYFPLLIPEEFLKREADHVEGFSPELAVVTVAGGKELEEKLVVRPTSETIIYYMFSRWITSWRDLPLKINQWANVVRWEMRTRPFLRTTEFLWQEGHTAHASREEAIEMAETMLKVYRDFAYNFLAIPVITGLKSDSEKFPGAERTYTFEGLMQDGKALQMGTSHVLNQSFPASFGVQYQDKDGTMKTPFCSSWGSTTRNIGAMVMVHGDQKGIAMPPRIAPIQVVIVPIARTDEERATVLAAVEKIEQRLKAAGLRIKVDADTEKTPGAKFFHWEARGVPVRLEIGPRDLAANTAVLVNRVVSDKNSSKTIINLDQLEAGVTTLLDQIHDTMLARATERRDAQWHQANTIAEIAEKIEEQNGLYQVGWCSDPACEAQLKEHKATTRCWLDEKKHTNCFVCGKPSKSDVLVAKSY